MCIVRIDTNVSASDIDEMLLVKSTESLANTFKKPKSVSINLLVQKRFEEKKTNYSNTILYYVYYKTIHFSII